MPRYKLIVMSSPLEGRERDYNDWYQNIHLPDAVKIDGVKSAQRYRMAKAMGPHETFPYLAIYDIETDDIGAVVDEMNARQGTERMPVTDALSPKAYMVMYEEFGDRVVET